MRTRPSILFGTNCCEWHNFIGEVFVLAYIAESDVI